MADIQHRTLSVGTGAEGRAIAVQSRPGGGPGLFWLGGFRSDMIGAKAMALDALGPRQGLR